MKNKKTIKKLFKILKPYKKNLVFIICCLIISTIINLLIPILSKSIMDKGFIGKDKKVLICFIIWTFLLRFIDEVIDIIKEKKRIGIQTKIRYSLWEKAFSHLMKLNIKYFTDTNNAQFMNNMEVDIRNICSICDASAIFVITQVFNISGGIIGLFIINRKLTVLVLIFIPVKYVVVNYFAKKRKSLVESYIKEQEDYAKWFGNTIGGIKEIRIFNIQKNKEEEFKTKQETVIKKQKELEFIGSINLVADSVLVNILVTTLYIVGSNMVFDLSLTVGSIFAFITYSTYVTSPISAILNIGYFLSGIIPSTKRYYEFLDLDKEMDENPKNDNISMGDIEFCNVNFSYDNTKNILENVNFKIKKSSKVALIGANGSGKSTLINLILRMYKPDRGTIKINKQDINKYNLEKYRSMISIVNQQIYLFNDSIKNNILLYKQTKDEKMKEVIEDTSLEELIKENTLDYKVGENGCLLSGGQKQKIALARALIQDKPIIIFDEATSNTDVISQMHINNILKTKLKDKTILIVTHKSEILKDVDQIIMLKEGKIVCCGAYDTLIKNNKDFKDMMKFYKHGEKI